MSPSTHTYSTRVRWTGNLGSGTASITSYSRRYTITVPGKPAIAGSADAAFGGEDDRHNPEDLFVAAISACHMLTYLALAARRRVTVLTYEDDAVGRLELAPEGGGKLSSVLLRPVVGVTSSDLVEPAIALHEEAARHCFIANSCIVPIRHTPEVLVMDSADNGVDR